MQGDLHSVCGGEGEADDEEGVMEDVDQGEDVHLDVVLPVGGGVEGGDVEQGGCGRQAEVDVGKEVEDIIVVEEAVGVDLGVEGTADNGEDEEPEEGDGDGDPPETFREVVDAQAADGAAKQQQAEGDLCGSNVAGKVHDEGERGLLVRGGRERRLLRLDKERLDPGDHRDGDGYHKGYGGWLSERVLPHGQHRKAELLPLDRAHGVGHSLQSVPGLGRVVLIRISFDTLFLPL